MIDRRQRRDEELLRAIGVRVPQPFTVNAFLKHLDDVRGRQIVLESMGNAATAGGLVISTLTRDYIVVSEETTALHRLHIAYHEIAHLLLGHRGTPLASYAPPDTGIDTHDDAGHELLYTPEEEWAAESLATTIAAIAESHWETAPRSSYLSRCVRRAMALSARDTYRRLYPLWRALVETEPHITFEGPPPETAFNRALPLADPWRNLYRRVIETYDGIRLVGRRLDPHIVDSAQRLAVTVGVELTMAEAVGLGAGLAAAVRSRTPPNPQQVNIAVPRYEPGEGLLSNALALAEIAGAFTRWPLISDGSSTQAMRPFPLLRRWSRPARTTNSPPQALTHDVGRSSNIWTCSDSVGIAHGFKPLHERGDRAVESDDKPGNIDTGRATAARMYDYYLGGTTNFPADRAAADQIVQQIPLVPAMARTHRAALQRAVRFLAEQGVRQFLDLGSGIPTMGHVHEIAQQVAPDVRTLGVDIDPVAVLDSRQLFNGNDFADSIEGDLRQPSELLHRIETSPELAAIINLGEPVGLVLACVLHFIPDDEEANRVMDVLLSRLASGSWLLISHASRESYSTDQVDLASRVYKQSTATPGGFRSRDQVLQLFRGTQLVEPGLVWTPQWRPTPDDSPLFKDNPEQAGLFIGVARVAAG